MSQSLIDFLSKPEVWAVAAAIAGFLTLTWVIRGAPIGQATAEEPDDAPSSGYRDRVIASAVIGFLLVVGGAFLAVRGGVFWSVPVFAAGFGIILAVINVNRRYRHASPTMRRLLEFSNTALAASLIGGILVVGNVFAFKYGGRAIDLTRDRSFSLSSRTVSVVQAIDRPVSFDVFFGNSPQSRLQVQRVEQLLSLYKASNPSKVKVEYLDPNRDRKEFEELAKRAHMAVAPPEGGIVVTYGEGEGAPMSLITTLELFEVRGSRSESRPDRFISKFFGEDVVTSALIRLREGERSRIAYSTGHDESPLGELDPSQPGVGLWRARLGSVGIDVVEANLNRDEVPADVSLLVICAPKRPFRGEELQRIKSFIIRGGQLIIMVGNEEPNGLDELLKAYNVEIGQGRVVDPRFNWQRRPFAIYAPIPPGSSQPIVESLGNQVIFLPYSAPLETLGGSSRPGSSPTPKPSNPGVVAQPFLRSSPESWVESNPTERPVTRDPVKDKAGPVNVGVVVFVKPRTASEKPIPRMVIFSSASTAENQVVSVEPANLDLLMNAIQWLKGRPEVLGIDPKTHESLLFAADPGLRVRLVMVPTLLAVVVIIGLGATTYMARRD